MAVYEEGPKAAIIDVIEEHTKSSGYGSSHEHIYYLVVVQKGKDESVVDVQNPTFMIQLDRTDGSRLGFKLDIQSSSKSLYIKEIVGSLALDWNIQNSDKRVRPGDRITKVNGVEGNTQRLMEECRKNTVLNLEIFRSTAVPVTAGLQAIVQTETTFLPEGMEGTVVKVDQEGDALIRFENKRSQWISKLDFGKFTFKETERYYLRRYADFRDLLGALKTKLETDKNAPIQSLPSMPSEERFGFRRQLSNLGVGSFNQERLKGLQKYLELVMSQIPRMEAEPLVQDFFGPDPLPDVPGPAKDSLRTRMDVLLAKHKKTGIYKEGAESVGLAAAADAS